MFTSIKSRFAMAMAAAFAFIFFEQIIAAAISFVLKHLF